MLTLMLREGVQQLIGLFNSQRLNLRLAGFVRLFTEADTMSGIPDDGFIFVGYPEDTAEHILYMDDRAVSIFFSLFK